MSIFVRVFVPLALLGLVGVFAFGKLQGDADEELAHEGGSRDETLRTTSEVQTAREVPSAIASEAAPGNLPPDPVGDSPVAGASPVEAKAPEAAAKAPSMRVALKRLDRKIRNEPFSTRVTRKQQSWAQDRLAAHGVEPVDLELGCSARMCRALFTFDSIRHARDLALIRLPSEFSVIYGAPQPLRSGQVELLLFWSVDGTNLRDVLREP